MDTKGQRMQLQARTATEVADRLKKLSESQTLALTKRVRELRAEGKNVLGLTLGEPDFDTPQHICEAAVQAIREGFTHYPPVAGIPDLRQALAEKLTKQNGIPTESGNIVVSTGAKQSLVNVIMSLVNPGEETILIQPYWVSYIEMLKMADAKITTITTDIANDYKVTPEQLDQQLSDKSKLIIFNSPSNPCGAMYSEVEWKALVEVLEKYPNLFIVSDEIYEHITYDERHVSLGSFESIRDRVITINGFSKGFAMTGWRIGYIGAPAWIAKACEKFQGQVTSGACSISQRAALEAATSDLSETYKMRDAFAGRRDLVYNLLAELEDIRINNPQGAFYFYPDMSAYFGRKTKAGETISNIDELQMYLLERAMVAVIPGTAFGTDKHIRISYAYAAETLSEACTRMKEALSELK